MARTAIPVTALAKNAGVAMATAEGATSVDQANGMVITGVKLSEKLLLRVTNTAAAAHGIIRQESSFDRGAVSPANARGLMQLVPGTAQIEARRIGVPFSLSTPLSISSRV